jgi:glutamate 5-kinase
VVVKIGSNVLSHPKGGLDHDRIGALCRSIAAVRAAGSEVIVVSSGAVAAGRGLLKLDRRPSDLADLQAVAAVGQGALMEAWGTHLRPHALVAAQLLLTRDDMEDRRRYLNMRNALIAMLDHRVVVPVINENDTTTVDELKFGDNDMLSAMVAAKLDSDLLLILSNVPGLMTDNPKTNPNAAIVPVVKEIGSEVEALVCSTTSSLGTGGMKTKLMAARHATQFGVSCVIADGGVDDQIQRVASGDFTGTWFVARSPRRAGSARRHWISTKRPAGDIIVDEGAERALLQHKSLLAIGIRGTAGTFEAGDVVRVLGPSGNDLGHGIANFDRAVVERIKGRKEEDAQQLLGELTWQEVIHCDNLVVDAP